MCTYMWVWDSQGQRPHIRSLASSKRSGPKAVFSKMTWQVSPGAVMSEATQGRSRDENLQGEFLSSDVGDKLYPLSVPIFFKSKLYTQCAPWTHDSEVESHTLNQLSQPVSPGVPIFELANQKEACFQNSGDLSLAFLWKSNQGHNSRGHTCMDYNGLTSCVQQEPGVEIVIWPNQTLNLSGDLTIWKESSSRAGQMDNTGEGTW